MIRPANPVAFITGGRRGIGRGIAFALADAGFDLVINDIAEDDAMAETLAGIAARGRRGIAAAGDIADLARQPDLVARAWDAFGAINCLVNNAGIPVLARGDLLDLSVESWDRNLATNLRGPFFLTQKIARRMIAAGDDGRYRSIVCISSANARMPSTNRGEYCVAKTGVAMMAQLFAVRLAEHGIGVHDIRPGIIRTDMTAGVAADYQRQIAAGVSPMPRWGEPADIGRAVAALASGAFAFSTGSAYEIDGGLHINRL